MPAPPPDNPNVCRVNMVFQRDTREFMNTFHIENGTEWNLVDMATLAEDFVAWWTNHYRLAMPTAVELVQVQVRKYKPEAPLAYDREVSPPIAGGRANPPAPGNATLTMSFRTGLAGRRFRGRVYVPSLEDGTISDNDTVLSTIVNLISSAGAELLFSALTNGALGVFHAPKEVPTPFDNTITQVLSGVVEDLVDSQRRRLPGRGR